MSTQLTAAGVEQTRGGATIIIRWERLRAVTASNVDHMTQRIAMLTFEGGHESDGEGASIELSEPSPGWDAAVRDLAEQPPLAVDVLGLTLAVLNADDATVVYARRPVSRPAVRATPACTPGPPPGPRL